MENLIDANNCFTEYGFTVIAMQQAAIQWGRGTVCVLRQFEGKPAAFRIHDQRTYKEWAGCFSIIHG